MPDPATLDVLIPHFECASALEVSLSSVAAQSWNGRLRVVLVDDGSSPESFQQVRRVASAQPFPVDVTRLERNVGRPRARNLLLRKVTAPYLAWLDAGDSWYPDKLSIQFDHLTRLAERGVNLDRTWVTCHYDWVQNGERRLVRQRTGADQLADLMLGDRLRAYLWTVLGRSASFRAAGLFDERLRRMQDLDYFLRFVRCGGVLSVPEDDVALCRYEKSDIGRNHRDVAECAELIMRKHRAAYNASGRGFTARVRWNHAALAARYALSNNEPVAAGGYMTAAMIRSPRYTAFRLRRRWLR